MAGPEKISLNTATTTKQWSLAEAVDGCLRHGLGGICPWRSDIEATGLAESARLIRDSGLGVSGLCRGGHYTADGTLSQRVLDDNARAVDEAAEIGADCLVMVVGGVAPGMRDIAAARDTVTEGLARTLDHARRVGMPVAIEPLHPMYAADRACINTTGHALDICEALGPGIGVALDVYHIWWDPDILTCIADAPPERIHAFHICDWLRETRDMLTDRGMMGDGVADIPTLRSAVEAKGYTGLYEVEIFSNDWWQRSADEVMATIIDRAATHV